MTQQPQFSWPIRVYYEDTDAGGVVYHSNYLNFMERARTEWLRALGFEQTVLSDEFGVMIVIQGLSITYKSPARFNDLLSVYCGLAHTGRSSIDVVQTIARNGVTLAEAQVKAVFVSTHTFKPVAIPANIKAAMFNLKVMESV